MGCKCNQRSNVSIVQSSNVTLSLRLEDESTGEPYQLTGLVGATGYFPAADVSLGSIAASGVVYSSDRGIINVSLTPLQTLGMQPGDYQDFQLNIDQGAVQRVIIFKEALSVVEQLF